MGDQTRLPGGWTLDKTMKEWSDVVKKATRERDIAYDNADELPYELSQKAKALAEDIYDLRLKEINDKHKLELKSKLT